MYQSFFYAFDVGFASVDSSYSISVNRYVGVIRI